MANVLTPAGGIFCPPRGGRPKKNEENRKQQYISIHALREEGDFQAARRPEACHLGCLSGRVAKEKGRQPHHRLTA